MGIEPTGVHVLVQDLDSDCVQWWCEPPGSGGARIMLGLRVPPQRGAVWIARHWATDRGRNAGVPETVLPDIALLTSELVGNVVVHGTGGEIEVRFSLGYGRVTVEVRDTCPDPPVLRDTGARTPGNEGLRLVAAIAQDWGHRPRPGGLGKVVWFTLTA